MLLPNKFREILAAKGRDLRSIGLNEVALAKPDAIAAVRSLEGHQIAVLGGDVYYEKEGKIRPTHENWFCNQNPNESPLEFAKRSQKIASDFLLSHNIGTEANQLYVLVLSGLGIVGPKTGE